VVAAEAVPVVTALTAATVKVIAAGVPVNVQVAVVAVPVIVISGFAPVADVTATLDPVSVVHEIAE
jgi:hypothetical protein